MTWVALVLALGFGVGSWLGTGAVRRYALARALLDIPNRRSSHRTPTPRGGGLAIAASACSGIAVLAALGWVAPTLATALVGGGVAVAGVGWLDDRRGVSAGARAAVHAVAAAWAVYWLGGFDTLRLGTVTLRLGVVGHVAAAVWIVWAANLYNFMDGIDGLAGVEGVTVGGFGATLLAASGDPSLAGVSLLIAAASAGFLWWNWSPAQIFMGDVGSGLLGFLLGTLSIASERAGSVPATAWVLLFGVFVFDATVTLVRRILRREVWYAAHRSHGYQRAVQSGWTHARVSAVVALINLGLAALAWVGTARSSLMVPALAVGAVVLTGVYLGVERARPMAAAE
jgi:Fuc2NAc and GlcNAc transferase